MGISDFGNIPHCVVVNVNCHIAKMWNANNLQNENIEVNAVTSKIFRWVLNLNITADYKESTQDKMCGGLSWIFVILKWNDLSKINMCT